MQDNSRKTLITTLRKLARHLILDARSLFELGRSPSPIPHVQLILLHQVPPEQESKFEQLVRWVKTNYQVVSYSDAISSLTQPNVSSNLAAFSFDDGVKNNLAAARILSQHEISACFFVCPTIIGQQNQTLIDQFCRQRMLFSNSTEFMNWQDLELIVGQGHEVGNHTNHHFYLSDLNDIEFEDEVASGKSILESRLGPIRHFAWPYGRFSHFQQRWVPTVIQLGHVSCASGERGCHAISPNQPTDGVPFVLRRESLNLDWPLRHMTSFLTRSSRNPIQPEQAWKSPR